VASSQRDVDTLGRRVDKYVDNVKCNLKPVDTDPRNILRYGDVYLKWTVCPSGAGVATEFGHAKTSCVVAPFSLSLQQFCACFLCRSLRGRASEGGDLCIWCFIAGSLVTYLANVTHNMPSDRH
jgi:hypothetical protein